MNPKNSPKSEVKNAVRTANKVATETGNIDAGIGAGMAALSDVGDIRTMLQSIAANTLSVQQELAKVRAENAELKTLATAPKVRTVKVAADGTAVVSSGKRGKPPTAGLDDCRDKDGKVQKVGVRAYANETSGVRKGTFRLASRGTHGPGLGECISKQAACPYTPKQLAIINSASEFLDFGLRFDLVKVTDSTNKLHPARHLTEIEAANQPVVASLLSSVGLDIDAWTMLRTTEDGTGEGEINYVAPETADVDATDDGSDLDV